MRKRFPAMLVIASAMVMAGCGDKSQEPDQAAQTGAAPSGDAVGTGAEVAAQISVSADKTHAVQPGDELTVTVKVTGFTLDAARIGQSNEGGVGHYRVYLDDASGDAFLAESGNREVKVIVPQDITDGSHELRVVLYNNDRTPVPGMTEGAVTLIVYRL